jgi:tRNA(Arg) A34 adenosine deaminase TadA
MCNFPAGSNDPAHEAACQAIKSTMGQRHGAVITHCGSIVGRGFNHHVTQYCHQFSKHAEVAAISDLKKAFPQEMKSKRWMKDTRMYIVRIGPDSSGHQLKLSKPCCACREAIEKAGIPYVFYSS